MNACLFWVYVQTTYIGTEGDQKRLEPMELELQEVVSHLGSAKNLESNQGKTKKLTNSAAITEATAIDNFNWGNKLFRTANKVKSQIQTNVFHELSLFLISVDGIWGAQCSPQAHF